MSLNYVMEIPPHKFFIRQIFSDSEAPRYSSLPALSTNDNRASEVLISSFCSRAFITRTKILTKIMATDNMLRIEDILDDILDEKCDEFGSDVSDLGVESNPVLDSAEFVYKVSLEPIMTILRLIGGLGNSSRAIKRRRD